MRGSFRRPLWSWCLAAILAGCAATPEAPEANFDRTLAIRWRVVDDPDARCRNVTKSGREQVWKIHGCAIWSEAEKTCDLWTGPLGPNSREIYRAALETLGHEILHCFIGQWHQ